MGQIVPEIFSRLFFRVSLYALPKLFRRDFTLLEFVNRSAKPAADVPVTLEVDGHLIETKKVTVAPGASGSVTFAEFTVAEANVRGKVSAASPDAWKANNDFFFVLSPSRPVSVLVVQSDGADRDANLYVTTALGIGDAPKFQVETINASKLTGEQTENRAVVILNDTPPQFARRIMTEGQRLLSNDERQERAHLRMVLSRAADLEPFLRRTRSIKLRAVER